MTTYVRVCACVYIHRNLRCTYAAAVFSLFFSKKWHSLKRALYTACATYHRRFHCSYETTHLYVRHDLFVCVTWHMNECYHTFELVVCLQRKKYTIGGSIAAAVYAGLHVATIRARLHWKCHVKRKTQSHHTYEWVISHIWVILSQITRCLNRNQTVFEKLCQIFEWVMPQCLWIRLPKSSTLSQKRPTVLRNSTIFSQKTPMLYLFSKEHHTFSNEPQTYKRTYTSNRVQLDGHINKVMLFSREPYILSNKAPNSFKRATYILTKEPITYICTYTSNCIWTEQHNNLVLLSKDHYILSPKSLTKEPCILEKEPLYSLKKALHVQANQNIKPAFALAHQRVRTWARNRQVCAASASEAVCVCVCVCVCMSLRVCMCVCGVGSLNGSLISWSIPPSMFVWEWERDRESVCVCVWGGSGCWMPVW